jgi:hypothetical protein
VNSIRITETDIDISTLLWSEDVHDFVAGPVKCFSR